MGSPSPSLISSTMHTFVLLSIVSLACGAPMPQEAEASAAVEEEAPAALPYVHDATGDVAEPYVHEEIPAVEPTAEEEIAAEPYVHEEIAAEAYVHDATGDVAEEYVHVEPGSCCGPCCCSRCDIRCLPLRRCIRRTRSGLSLRCLPHWMC